MNSPNEIIIIPPLYESLFDTRRQDSLFPDVILNDESINTEITTRQRLAASLDEVFQSLPHADDELTAAIDAGLLTLDKAADLYTKLAEFLEAKGHNTRLILYLPFELIPDINWKTSSLALSKAISRFHDVYVTGWQNLLSDHDRRAYFFDGDVLEPVIRSGPLPKVVKAAHLAEVLIAKGLITKQMVKGLIESSRDEILRQSLTESLKQLESKKDGKPEDNGVCLDQLPKLIHQRQAEIKQKLREIEGKVSPERIRWLGERDSQAMIGDFADQVSSAVARNVISWSDLDQFVKKCQKDELLARVAIEAVVRSLEGIPDRNLACTRYRAISSKLDKIRKLPGMQASVEGMAHRLSFLGIVPSRGSSRPGERFYPERMASQKQRSLLVEIVEKIKTDDEISKLLYPMLLVCGSRAKGYAPLNADFDLAVLVRPGVSLDNNDYIQKLLASVLSSAGLEASVIVFWLKEESEHLKIHDFEKPQEFQGGNHLAGLLFEAAWIGSACDIRDVFNGLLPKFLVPEVRSLSQPVKEFLVKEIERCTLQFRLLHKGYDFLYPAKRKVVIAELDPSTFWDSGYRQLATRLFITRVFLP